MIEAKIIEDSVGPHHKRITTFQLVYPRFIHAEFMTHRVFSRNASSSRAIPVSKMLEQVRNNPAMPIHWGKNQPGMQADNEFTDYDAGWCEAMWRQAANSAADIAEKMNEFGLHKQVANRILEPFQHIHVVMTATELQNFFELRAHKDAQPEIHELAIKMIDALEGSLPTIRVGTKDDIDAWHLPYVTDEERRSQSLENLLKISPARCCRVSYLKHDGSTSTIEEDIALCDRLAGSRPIHASPFEHQAWVNVERVGGTSYYWHGTDKSLEGNFVGWNQYRKLIEQSFR